MLTEEELRKIGVNPDNLYPGGEMNVIVQCLTNDEDDDDSGLPKTLVQPDIYHPRKNSVYSCGRKGDNEHDLTDPGIKAEYIKHLRDSAERCKIMSYYLSKQADEIEEFGYPNTSFYFPE